MSARRTILFLSGHATPSDLLLKASLPQGARWITVRPNGPGTEGHPVLIQPSDDGAYRVIGGAGGKLNYLKLTGVKSEADYAASARQSAASHREAKKRQRERDKADGLLESKTRAREVLKAQLADHQAKFVDTVATALGWTEAEMRFPEEKFQNASPEAIKQAARKHGADLFRRAQEAVDLQRRRLLQDAEARAQADLGEVKLSGDDPNELSVQDLDPVEPATKGFGYSTDYAKRAEARGLTKEELAAEAQAAKPPVDPVKAGALNAARAAQQKIGEELTAIRDPGPQVDPRAVVDAKKAVELLRAEKALKAVQRDAREKGKQIDQAKTPVEPQAYVLETGGPVDTDVVKDLESDLRTLKTRAFLEGVGKIAGSTESLGRYIGVGAYNSVNALSLASAGASLVDRSVVDVLGIAGAAQVVARRLQADLTPEEMGNVREAMSRFHVDHYMQLSDKALREAREWHELAHEIEVGEAKDGAELSVAQELNAKRRDAVANAQKVLGTALGEMEANAALVVALEQPKKDRLQVSLGTTSIEDAIRRARAIGLDRGDYQVERAGASTILTVSGVGMDKLAQPVSRDDLQRVRDSLDIIEGRRDEPDWLPNGIARRPDLAMTVKPGAAPRLAKPFPAKPGDMAGAIRDYIGGRTADGDTPADVVADLLSEDVLQRAGDRQAFMRALDEIAPLYGADGKMIRAESHQAAFEKMADEFVARTYGADRSPLHRQQFKVDDAAVDALHRALADVPEGAAAFKPVGELTPQDQGALRNAFAAEYGRADPAAEAMRTELGKLDQAEPEKEVDDMFGRGINPEWRDWQSKRNDLAERLNKASMTWGKYVTVMGSPANAYAAMQDVIASKLLRSFADHHNKLRPDAPLKTGKTVIRHDLNHLDALDPEARERRLSNHRQLVDSLRSRVAGKYSSGSVSDKIEAARAAEEAAAQAQMGLFGSDVSDTPAEPQERPVELGERYTIGHAAERQIAGMMPIVGENFRAGQPVKLWQPTMSGKYAGRQRAVKLIAQNRRTLLGMGVGSGKTSISLAGYTHLHSQGQAHRGLFVVPSVVQGQFAGEALTVLQPGKYRWHCDPGADRDARIAAYRDKNTHFNVVTHQAFRDDMLHLAAKREGVGEAAIAAKLDAMKPAERATYMRDLMAAEGIDHDYLAVDEGHNLLNRAGKANSHMANVLDAVSSNMATYVNMTADPIKNDASEAFDLLAKMDPAKYTDRDAFMRKYGVDTEAAKDGLKREMAKYLYTGSVDPGVKADKREISVEPSEAQHAEIKKLDAAAAAGRIARMRGQVDVDAMRTLSPHSFDGVDPAQHEAVAKKLQASIGIMHNAAVHHAIDGGAKTDALAKLAKERKGRPGVVFVHHLDRVQEIADRLTREGHRVVTLTGSDSSKAKDDKKRAFQAGHHDILVASDAGAVGANLQRGKWLVQYDTPSTAMVHGQRNGRIHRVGQTEDVELLDLVANHPAERRARKRLADKYELRSIMTSPLDGLDDRGIAGYLQRVRAGEKDAGQPLFVPGRPEDAEGLAPPDEQQSLF